MSYTFHIPALPHLPVTKLNSVNACAYTAKIEKFSRFMTKRGHQVILYGAEGTDADCTEFIQTVSSDDLDVLFPKYDKTKEMFKIDWDSKLPYWQLTNSRAIVEIKKRIKPHDFIGIIGGNCQQPISDAFNGMPNHVVEWGIGYSGIFSKYKVFESYAHMHKVYGSMNSDPNGDFYDCVIPNSFEVSDFPEGDGKGGYYLYLGRVIQRKGIRIAEQAVAAISGRLVIAGQGVASWDADNHKLVATDGEVYEGKHIEYVGFADTNKRSQLMGGAIAQFVPTIYLGPFEGVNVEAQMCGTPVISTDWGCFAETVEHGVTGYRCRSMEQFTFAAMNVHKLDRKAIRDRAIRLYSTDKAADMYEEYFDHLNSLWNKGFYEPNPNRTQLNWLNK